MNAEHRFSREHCKYHSDSGSIMKITLGNVVKALDKFWCFRKVRNESSLPFSRCMKLDTFYRPSKGIISMKHASICIFNSTGLQHKVFTVSLIDKQTVLLVQTTMEAAGAFRSCRARETRHGLIVPQMRKIMW